MKTRGVVFWGWALLAGCSDAVDTECTHKDLRTGKTYACADVDALGGADALVTPTPTPTPEDPLVYTKVALTLVNPLTRSASTPSSDEEICTSQQPSQVFVAPVPSLTGGDPAKATVSVCVKFDKATTWTRLSSKAFGFNPEGSVFGDLIYADAVVKTVSFALVKEVETAKDTTTGYLLFTALRAEDDSLLAASTAPLCLMRFNATGTKVTDKGCKTAHDGFRLSSDGTSVEYGVKKTITLKDVGL